MQDKNIPKAGLSSTLQKITDLGSCPTAKHVVDFRQCGFAGCVDLRPWARAHSYKYRLEESYQAEDDPHVRGDGRWFIEIPCKYGLIYHKGGEMLLAYANRRVKRHLAGLGLERHQTDGNAEVFKFPVGRLAEVAAILKPRRKRTTGASPEQLRAMRERRKLLVQSAQTAQETTFSVDEG